MTHCERLSDRMPEVAQGRSRWSAAEEAHLTGCADCRAEWELVRVAARLGGSLPAPPDAERISASVLQQLAADRTKTRRRTWSVVSLAAAAVLAAALWVGRPAPDLPVVVETPSAPVRAPTGLELTLSELDDLEVAELDSLLQTIDQPLADAATLDGPTLGDLDDQELERVLGAWEG